MTQGILMIADEMGQWYPCVASLTSLPDLDGSALADGVFIQWNATAKKWQCVTITPGSGATQLNELSDVTIASPQTGQLLRYSGTEWVNTSTGIAADSLGGQGIAYFATAAALTAHIGNTNNPHSVTKTQVGLSNVLNTKHNFSATAAPTAGDDTADGYGIGSIWVDTTADKGYICTDATEAAANWVELGGGGLSAITIQDEGTEQGQATTLNVTGSNASIAVAGGVATLTITGGTGGSIAIQEVDGSPAVSQVSTIVVASGDLTDNGGGSVRLKTASDVTAPASRDILELQIYT